jgi:hypothetical protein
VHGYGVVILFDWKPTFEWYLGMFVVTNGRQRHVKVTMRLDCARNIHQSRFNCKHTLKGLSDHLKRRRNVACTCQRRC